jgi:hypothetical protein
MAESFAKRPAWQERHEHGGLIGDDDEHAFGWRHLEGPSDGR